MSADAVHTPGRARWWAWAIWALSILMTATAAWIPPDEAVVPSDVLWLMVAVETATIGAVVATRVRGNPLGWVFLGYGTLLTTSGFLERTLGPESSEIGTWVGHWIWVPMLLIPVTVIVSLLPDGRLLPGRWRLFMWSGILGMIGVTLSIAFGEQSLGGVAEYGANPYFVPEASVPFDVAGAAGALLVLTSMGGGVASIVVRFRRSGGAQRQQLKWIGYGAMLAVLAIVAGSILGTLGARPEVSDTIVLIGPAVIPAAIGLAILRYRLYDIDRLISRTVSYAVVVALLAGVYGGGVFLLSQVIPSENEIAVAASTLLAAALFNPMRRRVQTSVDRRFNRVRYDSQRVAQHFASGLDEMVDVEQIMSEWVGVVGETLHPSQVAVWVKDAGT